MASYFCLISLKRNKANFSVIKLNTCLIVVAGGVEWSLVDFLLILDH